MDIWVCIYTRNQAIPSYSLPEKIVPSEEEAEQWKENALHHDGADLRFWTPLILKMHY